jgi:hypothetical protein
MTFLDSPIVTSSLELADGPTLSGSQDGKDQSGPDHAPVSRFRGQASDREQPTPVTFGLFGDPSSPSAVLQRSLENRLRATLDVNGSPEYGLTWKIWDMPSGPPICALRASARRTFGNGFGGWPTPMAGTPAQKGYNEAGNTDSSRKTTALVGWATPAARDHKSEEATDEFNKERWEHPRGKPLSAQATLAGWATPNTMDHLPSSNLAERKTKGGCVNLKDQAPLTAPTEKRGALNPAFSRWLMGFPAEWDDCAPTGTPSSPKSRRHS